MSLSHDLIRLESILTAMDRKDLLARLRPGRDRTTTATLLEAHSLCPPDDLLSLYEWHDGTDTTPRVTVGEISMFPGFYLASIDESIQNLVAFRRSPRWRTSWLPVFANGGGDFLIVDCDVAGGEFGRLLHFRIEESDHPAEYESIAAWAQSVVRAFDAGAISLDSSGRFMTLDDDAFAQIAAKANPSIDWWK